MAMLSCGAGGGYSQEATKPALFPQANIGLKYDSHVSPTWILYFSHDIAHIV